MHTMTGNMPGWGMMGSGMFFMSIFWLIVLVLLIVAGVYLVRSLRHTGNGGSRKESPLDILKKRYASGEINKQEFEEMKRDLLHSGKA